MYIHKVLVIHILVLAAAADASSRCAQSCSSTYSSGQRSNIIASIVFTWFLTLTFLLATVLSYLENKQGDKTTWAS